MEQFVIICENPDERSLVFEKLDSLECKHFGIDYDYHKTLVDNYGYTTTINESDFIKGLITVSGTKFLNL